MLEEYRAKRKFDSTTEPAGGKPRPHPGLIFVVQKHDATRLHYDFRLELDGVLKSWAVPKGFPWRKAERHLAVQVEDHPFDYKDFEGIIPEGNYGAGTVMLWDKGTYTVGGGDPAKALKEGKLHLFLSGEKLNDEWTLVRMRKTEREDKPQWLLLKSGSDAKPLSARNDDKSVVSGRSMRQIAEAADNEWQSDRKAAGSRRKAASSHKATAPGTAPKPEFKPSAFPKEKPQFVEPMKARLSRVLPRGGNWIYEIKFDGIRALAIKDGASVSLLSRAGNVLTSKYASLAEGISSLNTRSAVLDGEIAALDSQGRSSFQMLQCYHQSASPPPLVFYVFDVLNYEGRNIRSMPLTERKSLLEQILSGAHEALKFSPALTGDPERIAKEMQARGLEGLMAKEQHSIYEAGRRSGAWTKYKWVAQQEFVIGGYTAPKGGRNFFGALLVGFYKAGKLVFAGKVGTGFDEASLASLHKGFQKLVTPKCPFANLPEKRTGRSGGLTAGQMKFCTWVRPVLVCQVKFAEWTRDNHLRQPSFVGLREDKRPSEVVREI